MKRALLVFVGVMLTATVAQAVPASYLFDNFESYADPAAFQAAWPSWWTDNSSLTFFANWGYPATGGIGNGKSLTPGAFGSIVSNSRRNAHLLPQVAMPTDANPISMEYKLFDPGTAAGNTARQFVEIRSYKPAGDAQTTPWMPATYNNTDCVAAIQFGAYSAVAGGPATYAYRVPFAQNIQFSKDGGTTWTGVPNWTIGKKAYANRLSTPAWRTFRVTIGQSFLRFYIDNPQDPTGLDRLALDTEYLLRDATNNALPATWGGFDGVIVGSGLGTNTAAKYDNVLVTPEPMTLALLGFGSLLLRRRRVA